MRKAEWQAALAAHGEIGEELGLERIAIPAQDFDRRHGDAQSLLQTGHQGGIEPPAAAHIPGFDRRRKMVSGRSHGGNREGSQRRRTVGGRECAETGDVEIVTVEGFWRWGGEIRVCEKPCEHRLVDLPLPGQSAARIEGPARLRRHPVVDERIAGAAIEGDHPRLGRLLDIEPGDIGDAAEIEDRNRVAVRAEGAETGMMIDRRQGRTLAAGGDVATAKIRDDRNPGRGGESLRVAHLPGETLCRSVQQRVPGKADDIDGIRRHACGAQNVGHRGRVQIGQLRLEPGETFSRGAAATPGA